MSAPRQSGADPFAGIVLAAGRSRRMRGGHKLLRDLAGMTLIRRVVETALAAGLSPVAVVTPRDADGIRRALEGLGVRFVSAPEEPVGRLASVTAGVEALLERQPVPAGAVILLGDEPGVTVRHVAAVRAAVGQPPAPSRAAYSDRTGHPVAVPARYLTALPALARCRPPESRLWDLLLDQGIPCRTVTIDEPSPVDIDTESDLARAAERGLAPEARNRHSV